MKKTKIVCTIGPSCLEKETLKKMFEAGMNGARINTAYGNTDQHRMIVENVREMADIPIIVDVKGPEIRLQAQKRSIVKSGNILEVGFDRGETRFNHNFYDEISRGDEIYIDNGRIKTRVKEKKESRLSLLVMNNGEISDGKGVNVPNKQLSVPTLSKKDFKVIEFAKKHQIEYIALSFTRNVQDIHNLKSALSRFKGATIAKIENCEGLSNFQKILPAVDSIMIARGGLGVEINLESVPLAQKSMIQTCNQRGKTVVTATEMLESMMHQLTPTRAEASDVANAILDGTDAMMLSGETSIGKYPVEAVEMMTRIAVKTEAAATSHVEQGEFTNISDTVSKSIQRICQAMPVDKIVTLTRSGYTAKMISRFKLSQPIIAVAPLEGVRKQLELVFGVYPILFDYRREKDRILAVAHKLHSIGLVADEDTVLFTAAFRTTLKHASNLVEIHNIRELMDYTESH